MKRGVSALIATVIIIAFGVALAVFVITWGTEFIRSSQASVEEHSEEKFSCTTDIAFEVKCTCTSSGGFLSTCDYHLINNEDSIIRSISYRLFEGDTFHLSGIESLGEPGLEAWEISSDFIIGDDPEEDLSAIPADNIELEVLATQVKTGGKIINCGNLAVDVVNCVIS